WPAVAWLGAACTEFIAASQPQIQALGNGRAVSRAPAAASRRAACLDAHPLRAARPRWTSRSARGETAAVTGPPRVGTLHCTTWTAGGDKRLARLAMMSASLRRLLALRFMASAKP